MHTGHVTNMVSEFIPICNKPSALSITDFLWASWFWFSVTSSRTQCEVLTIVSNVVAIHVIPPLISVTLSLTHVATNLCGDFNKCRVGGKHDFSVSFFPFSKYLYLFCVAEFSSHTQTGLSPTNCVVLENKQHRYKFRLLSMAIFMAYRYLQTCTIQRYYTAMTLYVFTP